MRRVCPYCFKPSGVCQCDPTFMCQRCFMPQAKCECENSLRPEREFDGNDDRFEMDEDVADELRRQYGDRSEERSSHYWHGYNTVRKIGIKRQIRCPYQGDAERHDFYRGVSDARSRF